MKSLPVQGWSAPLTGNPLALIRSFRLTTVFTVWTRPVFTNPKSFCVMYVCLAWTDSPCWNGWKSFFRILFLFLWAAIRIKNISKLPFAWKLSAISKSPWILPKSPRQSGKPLIFTYRNATHEEERSWNPWKPPPVWRCFWHFQLYLIFRLPADFSENLVLL